MAKETKPNHKNESSRLETILAYMAAGLVGTSILAILATLITSLNSKTIWPVIVFYPQIGLIAGAGCIIALLIVSLRRRSRENNSK